MRLKRFFALLLCLSLAISLAGCQDTQGNPSGSPASETTTPPADTSPDALPGESPSVAPKNDKKPTDTLFLVKEEPIDGIEFQVFFIGLVDSYFANNPSGTSGGTSGGPDPNVPLDQQYYSESDGVTWFDVFQRSVADDLHYYIALYLEAKKDGATMNARYREQMDLFFSDLHKESETSGKSVEELIEGRYLLSISEERLKTVFERRMMGLSFEEEKRNSYKYTDQELEAYFEQNKDKEGNNIYEGNAVSVRHILMSDKAKADEVFAEFESGDKTEASFIALVRAHSEDEESKFNDGLYPNVTPGKDSQDYDAFDAWCFDPARKPGDYGHVETAYGQHLLYFSAVGEPYWKVWSRTSLLNADFGKYCEELEAEYPLKVME